jgi:predicted transcriptional regulator of viral defense system
MQHSDEWTNRSDQVRDLAKQLGVVRPRDLANLNIPRVYLQRLYERGELVRSARGLYHLADMPLSQTYTLAQACARIPTGVICLLSALSYYSIGTENPHQIWMAISRTQRTPRDAYPPLRVLRFSGPAMTSGIEEHITSEGKIRVYSVVKTVVDCFRFRNKVGIDVALEALRECRRRRRASMDDIWQYAKLLRVAKVMEPYLVSLT